MEERLKILYQGGEHEIVEKKSRFIAAIRPVLSEEEAVSFIAEQKKRYWDASHSCSAFVIGDQNELVRASDDGEPPQTAGRPMLDVLSGSGIHNACAVVTRYFGGTLLGTGGLVRAYSLAVKECLKHCRVMEKCLAVKLEIQTDYAGLGRIRYIAGEMEIALADIRYSDTVQLTLLPPAGVSGALKAKLAESTGGRCVIEEAGTVYFGRDGKKIIFF